jgi:hypothetical protein
MACFPLHRNGKGLGRGFSQAGLSQTNATEIG